jgi:hypothetical protein
VLTIDTKPLRESLDTCVDAVRAFLGLYGIDSLFNLATETFSFQYDAKEEAYSVDMDAVYYQADGDSPVCIGLAVEYYIQRPVNSDIYEVCGCEMLITIQQLNVVTPETYTISTLEGFKEIIPLFNKDTFDVASFRKMLDTIKRKDRQLH